jgi:hypothetical protein
LENSILAVLRVLGTKYDLAACKGDVAPPQVEQLALTPAGLKSSDDQRLKVWFRGL